MPTQLITSGASNKPAHAARFLLLCLAFYSDWAHAGAPALNPSLSTAIQINASTALEISGGQTTHLSTVGAQLSLEYSSPRIPVTTGAFADLNLSSQDQAPYFQVLGGWASFGHGRWRLATSVAHFSSQEVSGTWIYLHKLQYELRPGHKLALTAFGSLERSRGPGLRLIYKTRFKDRFNVELGIGIGKNRPLDVSASSSMTWDVL